MNLSNALEANMEGDWGYKIRMEDIDRMALAGFDTIRLPVKWSAYADEAPPYAIDPAIFARTDEIIDYALSRGLKVILNVHHYDELNQAPDQHATRLIGIWQQLSDHYQLYPDTLIYEVANEPNGEMTNALTDEINRKVLKVIRETQPDRWVVLATGEWATMRGLLASQPPKDRRVILSLHYYDPFDFTHQGAHFVQNAPKTGRSWGSAQEFERIQEDMAIVADFRNRMSAPLLIGEFGVYKHVPIEERAQWIKAVRKSAEAEEFGWCHWGFASAFQAYDLEQDEWLEPIRTALIDPVAPLAGPNTAP